MDLNDFVERIRIIATKPPVYIAATHGVGMEDNDPYQSGYEAGQYAIRDELRAALGKLTEGVDNRLKAATTVQDLIDAVGEREAHIHIVAENIGWRSAASRLLKAWPNDDEAFDQAMDDLGEMLDG